MAVNKAEIGFGFDPTESTHHFVLVLPISAADALPLIVERYTYGETTETHCPEVRARIDTYTWGRVAEAVQSHFNRRLKDAGRRTARFEPGENLLAPYLGKELTLLFWALDEIDATDLPNALANWQGFAQEERWWLYSTVKGSGAGPGAERERGWRKAIRIAFAEHPAPPPAEETRGMVPTEILPIKEMHEEYSATEVTPAEAPKQSRRKRKAQPPLPSLFDGDNPR